MLLLGLSSYADRLVLERNLREQRRTNRSGLVGERSEPMAQPDASGDGSTSLFAEKQFREMLCRERKRCERSRKHLILMLIDSEVLPKSKNDKIVLGQIAKAVSGVVRETDLTGWFEQQHHRCHSHGIGKRGSEFCFQGH